MHIFKRIVWLVYHLAWHLLSLIITAVSEAPPHLYRINTVSRLSFFRGEESVSLMCLQLLSDWCVSNSFPLPPLNEKLSILCGVCHPGFIVSVKDYEANRGLMTLIIYNKQNKTTFDKQHHFLANEEHSQCEVKARKQMHWGKEVNRTISGWRRR